MEHAFLCLIFCKVTNYLGGIVLAIGNITYTLCGYQNKGTHQDDRKSERNLLKYPK
jgi:hypothetical protein